MTVKLTKDPQTEAQHQRNVIAWSQIHRTKYPELALLIHIPNGGTRDPIEGRHLQLQGVKKGVPDLFLPVPRRGFHGLWIEMKTPTGRTSEPQRWWRQHLADQGYKAEICKGWESAVKLIEDYLNGRIFRDSR